MQFLRCSARTSYSSHCLLQHYRQVSNLPPVAAVLFQYAQDCNLTKGMQFVFEGLHDIGLPWTGAIVLAGLALRLATSPTHILADKLLSQRVRSIVLIDREVHKKFGSRYKLNVVLNEDRTRLQLDTADEEILANTRAAVEHYTLKHLTAKRLQASRIQNLKLCTVPVWVFSSFAIRNIISSDVHPAFDGILWFPDLIVPDPYFVLPVLVGIFGLFNLWVQKRIYPVRFGKITDKYYNGFLAVFTIIAVRIMIELPACIPLYWLMVSSSGLVQNILLRLPRVKSVFGIGPLPTDSSTPFKDIFFRPWKQPQV